MARSREMKSGCQRGKPRKRKMRKGSVPERKKERVEAVR
jgi:hypothetical protein